jgi:hypothetical protein
LGEQGTYDADDEALAETILRRGIVPCGDDGEDIEDDERADRGNEVDRSTTKLVDQESEDEVLAQRQRLHATVDTKLCLRIRQANVIHNVLEVVRNQSITAPLAEETNSSDDTKPLHVTFRLEEVRPPGLSLLLVEFDSGTYFGVFELYELVVFVAFTVPAREHGKSFFVPVFVAEPAGRFGHEEDEAEDYYGAYGLEERGETPGPVALRRVSKLSWLRG